MKKLLSRKFILTILVLGLVAGLPLLFKQAGVADAVTMAVLAIVGGVSTAYGVANLKEASIEKLSGK